MSRSFSACLAAAMLAAATACAAPTSSPPAVATAAAGAPRKTLSAFSGEAELAELLRQWSAEAQRRRDEQRARRVEPSVGAQAPGGSPLAAPTPAPAAMSAPVASAKESASASADLFDASDIASCRMYMSFGETWSGLMKNATEGFAKMPLLPVMTVLMLLAFVLPVVCAIGVMTGLMSPHFWIPVLCSCFMSYLPRFLCCLKFDRAWLACLLNPASIILFLTIQWSALISKSRGKGVEWRQRSYEIAPS